MRKIIGILFTVILLSMASASVSDVDFEELPTAWETGEELDFRMESSGSGLDRAYFQSRSPGEPGFTDRESKLCTVYTSCDWSFQHTEDESRTFEYRFWVESIDGDEEDSDTQRVTYHNNIDYSVEWTNRPPETSSQGSQVSMSVTAHDSAGRFDTEGVLHLQYRRNGDWESFDTRRCSNSYSSETCSNQGTTTLDSQKIEDGTARFRGKVVFKGDVTSTTSTASTSVGEQGRVDLVDIDSLPDEAEDGTSFEIHGDAEGENLQRIYIQQREPGESGWTDWRSRSCSGDTCEITRSYEVDGTGEREFRVYAEAPGDSRGSSPEYVDFVEQEPDERVDSVVLDELPDRATVDSEIEVTGTAEGENLDEIVLKTKERYEDSDEVSSESCSGDSCDFDYDFETSETGGLSFKLVARAGGFSRDSNIEMIEFYEEEEFRVDDVDLDSLPDEHPTGEEMEVTGDADGENLERLILQKRDPGDDWEPVETEYCSESSSCEFDDTYQQDDEDEVDFRLRAEAGDDSENSNRETVDFQDEVDDEIDSVNIDDLPSEHPVDEGLEISGEAEGENLVTLTIQERDSDEDDWDDWRSEDCYGDDYCEISRDFSTSVEEEKEFRIRAEADGDAENSGTETVEFVEEEDGEIDSVDINNLPSEIEEGESFDIEVDADGENLQTLRIQQRDPGDDWNSWRSTDCDGEDTCSLERSYTVSGTGEKDFRAYVETFGDSEASGVENVDFVPRTRYFVENVVLEEIADQARTGENLDISGEAEGENLDEIVLKTKERYEDWNEVSSESCSGGECSFDYDFETSEAGYLSFRLTAIADGNSRDSNIEAVNFYEEEEFRVDSVSIDDLPSTHPTGENLVVTGDAQGENLETLELQKRENSGWETVETVDCFENPTCEFDGDYQQSSEGEVDFRLKAEADGDSEFSAVETVEFQEEDDDGGEEEETVDQVGIDSLPEEHPAGSSLLIGGDASGENLDSMTVQVRNPGGSWSDHESAENCGDSSTCSISSSYSTGETGDKEFRIRAEAGEDSRVSSTETVDFYTETGINSISIDELPDSELVGSTVQVSGSMTGENLGRLEIQRKYRYSSWTAIESTTCSGNSCSLNTDYTEDMEDSTSFRLRGISGGSEEFSGVQMIEYMAQPAPEVTGVELENLPGEVETGETIEVEASASGRELESLEISYREEGGDWNVLDSTSCSGSSCDLTSGYSSDTEQEVEFRAEAAAGDDTAYSGIEVVRFQSEDAEELQASIGNLPGEYPTEESLEIEGWADGEDIEDIEIQSREEGGNWQVIDSSSCSGDYCAIETSFTEEDETTRDFRVRAFTEDEQDTSSVKTVTFEDDAEDEPYISSVEIEGLPEEHELDEELEIEASASGNELETLIIQERERYESWDDIYEEDCDGDDECEAETDFETSDEGEVEFRAVAEAGSETRRSGIEVVDFLDEDRDREEDSNLWVKVEDDEGDDLEDARVRVRNGDSETGYTDRDGEVDFELDPDDYDVIASKPGYATEERDIEIEEDETRSIRFRLERVNDFSVSASHKGEICRGGDLGVEVEVTNFDNDEESFEISGEGLGGETDTEEVEVDEDETETVTLIFRDVEDVDGGDFTVRVEDTVIRTLSRSVDVNDCVDRAPQDRNIPQGLSARVDPGEVLTGERVKVSGDVQGVKRPVDVTVESGGFEMTVSSTRSGGYSVFFTPREPRVRNVKISAGGFSTERQVRVLPRASVARVDAPSTVVEGEEFEICGEVNSDVEAKVMLFREDDKLDSKLGSGNVCFETHAGASGEKRYMIQASTYGQTGSAVKRIEVLEAGEEFDRFPRQITVEKTEPGQAKVELYNQDGNVARYSLEIEDIDSSWVSQTAENVVLRPGERETVYLYFSPGRSGDFNPEVVVERDGEEAFRKHISISSQDTGRGRRFPGILDLLF
jgi:hypothetical protein